MNFTFDHTQGLILIEADVEGPTKVVRLTLALDTGATDTLINATELLAAGYSLGAAHQVPVLTGATTSSMALFPVTRLRALGQERSNFSVLAHNLPAGCPMNGVIGLDFLRGLTLTVDFRTGQLTLA